MKIIIADDEYYVRQSLKANLEYLLLDPCIHQAMTGEEALNLLQHIYPDIVFMDIRMPGLDGLSCIRKMKQLCPNTQFIILTGHSRFEYAKEALELGVKSYLLKPISKKDLQLALQTAKKSKATLDEHINNIFAKDIWNFTTWQCQGSYYYGKILCEPGLDTLNLYNTLKEKLLPYISHDFNMALRPLPHSIDCIWYSYSRKEKQKEKLDCFLKHLEAQLIPFGNKATLLISPISKQEKDLKRYYYQLENLCILRLTLGLGGCYTLSELKNYYRQADPNELKILVQSEHLCHYFTQKKYLEYMKTLQSEPLRTYLLSNVSYKGLHVYYSAYIPLDCSREDVYTTLSNLGNQLLKRPVSEHRSTINEINQFIHTHYADDIGVAELADHLDLTPNYVSTLYKKHTGVTFSKYLAEVRMTKAKELLASNMPISDIAESVGYLSTRHFSKMFKKFFLMTPSQFRQKIS